MIMPAATAEKIYKEYQAALAAAGKQYAVAYPDTLLPYPKEKIKQAIKAHAGHLKTAKKLDVEATAALRSAFIALGKFTVAADAEFVKEYNTSLATTANAGFAEKTKRSQFITNKVHIQEEDCLQDYRVFFSRLVNDRALGGQNG